MPPLHSIDHHQDVSSWQSEDDCVAKPVLEIRSVRFCDDVSIREIDIQEDDITERWMVQEDFVEIRQNVVDILRMARSPGPKPSLDLRGLEHKTPSGHQRRLTNRKTSICAVLNEQEFQRHTSFADPDGLASVYRQCCHRPLIEAKIMGMRDEIAIKHDTILQRKQTLNNFKDQYFNHFKTLAKSYVKAERLEI